jgi:phage N-6-adenine-methyltransferase
VNAAMFSSDRGDWGTPQWLFGLLDADFNFALDACAREDNAKCGAYLTPEMDALAYNWAELVTELGGGAAFMNPPYGRGVGPWILKAHATGDAGTPVVCLLPARIETNWFSPCWAHASLIRFVKGRLKFEGASSGAPFPSVIVVFGPLPKRMRNFDRVGSWDPKKGRLM